MSSASSLRSMSTASSGLSSLSTYVPLAGGKSGQFDLGFGKMNVQNMLLGGLVAYAIVLALRQAQLGITTTINNVGIPVSEEQLATVFIAFGAFVGAMSQFDLGLGKMNGRNMLLGGLVAYAIVLALRQAQLGITTTINKVGIPVSEEQLATAFIGFGAFVGAMMK